MSLATVKAILLDAVGTLIHPEPCVEEAYRAAGLRQGLDLPADVVRERFRSAIAADASPAGSNVPLDDAVFRTDAEHEQQRWRRIVHAIFPNAPAAETLYQSLWDHFARSENWRSEAELQELTTALTRQGYQLGVASNFDSRLRAMSGKLLPAPLREQLFISAEIGWRKPAVPFYRHVERTLQLAPQEILLVGDDLLNDYLAPRAAGWQAFYLGSAPPDQVPQEHQLRRLMDLPVLLASTA